jgi:hypothetical protein
MPNSKRRVSHDNIDASIISNIILTVRSTFLSSCKINIDIIRGVNDTEKKDNRDNGTRKTYLL